MLIPFNRIVDSIDRVNAAIGCSAAWCSLFVVLAEFATVVMRYAFGIGSIAVQESVLYAQAALFLLAAALGVANRRSRAHRRILCAGTAARACTH